MSFLCVCVHKLGQAIVDAEIYFTDFSIFPHFSAPNLGLYIAKMWCQWHIVLVIHLNYYRQPAPGSYEILGASEAPSNWWGSVVKFRTMKSFQYFYRTKINSFKAHATRPWQRITKTSTNGSLCYWVRKRITISFSRFTFWNCWAVCELCIGFNSWNVGVVVVFAIVGCCHHRRPLSTFIPLHYFKLQSLQFNASIVADEERRFIPHKIVIPSFIFSVVRLILFPFGRDTEGTRRFLSIFFSFNAIEIAASQEYIKLICQVLHRTETRDDDFIEFSLVLSSLLQRKFLNYFYNMYLCWFWSS